MLLENDVLVLLPRTLRKVRKRLLWVAPGPPNTVTHRCSVWNTADGSVWLFPDYAIVNNASGSLFADYMVLPGHLVKDRKVDLSIREAGCCKAHLTGPYTDICTDHRLDAEALRLVGM